MIRPRYKTEPKVYMYGSYAKGYANPDSDIDVAVIVPAAEITDPWEQWAENDEQERNNHKTVP